MRWRRKEDDDDGTNGIQYRSKKGGGIQTGNQMIWSWEQSSSQQHCCVCVCVCVCVCLRGERKKEKESDERRQWRKFKRRLIVTGGVGNVNKFR